jgi:hypothetical protein
MYFGFCLSDVFKLAEIIGTLSWMVSMARIKCKKCGNVFDQSFFGVVLAPHVGPYNHIKCPACGKNSWFNVYSSVKDPITWPPEAKQQEPPVEPVLTEEEQENKRIEESKYEKP